MTQSKPGSESNQQKLIKSVRRKTKNGRRRKDRGPPGHGGCQDVLVNSSLMTVWYVQSLSLSRSLPFLFCAHFQLFLAQLVGRSQARPLCCIVCSGQKYHAPSPCSFAKRHSKDNECACRRGTVHSMPVRLCHEHHIRLKVFPYKRHR